jgi:hypothetical protein
MGRGVTTPSTAFPRFGVLLLCAVDRVRRRPSFRARCSDGRFGLRVAALAPAGETDRGRSSFTTYPARCWSSSDCKCARKTSREIAEQQKIDELGGVRNLLRKRNPIGQRRLHLIDVSRAIHGPALDRLRGHVLAMTLAATICSALADVFRAEGFGGRGRRWKRRISDVITIIEIDSPPKSQSVAIDVGVWADAFGGDEPAGTIHCPLLMHMETMPLGDESDGLEIARAFDLRSEIPEEARLAVVTHTAEALARYLADLRSLGALREAYQRGELASAVMRAHVRTVLADGARDGD